MMLFHGMTAGSYFGTQWLMNIRVEKNPNAGRTFFCLYKQAMRGSIEAQSSFRRDGCCPPRCVVANPGLPLAVALVAAHVSELH
jgi:hypothetical protein